MNDKPLVSIITASFNSQEVIGETYESILKQSYTNWEWLVTDDCSIDDTFYFLKKIALKDKRVKIFRNLVNSGAAMSRNNSLNNINGEFVAFIDSDDLWLDDKLSNQIEFMNKNDIDFSFTPYELINKDGIKVGKKVDIYSPSLVKYNDMLKKSATLGCSTVILRVSAINDLTMPLIRTGQDYALWLKILKSGVNAHKYNSVMTQYRILPNSISRNKFKKALRQWSIYRSIENLSISYSMYCFFFYAYRAIFRK